MFKIIFSTFLIDFIIFLSFLVAWFLCYFLINRKRKNSIEKNFFDTFKKYISILIKWFIIIFIIHCIYKLYNHFINFIQENVTYDSIPLLALLFDMLKSLFTLVAPFVVPVIFILLAIISFYGVVVTSDQYSSKSIFKKDLLYATKVDNSTEVAMYQTNGSLAEDNDDNEDSIPSTTIKRKYENKNTNHNNYKRRLPEGWVRAFLNNSFVCFSKMAKFLPTIFFVVVICVGANTLFLNVKNIGNIVNDQKRINELHLTIKNLSRAESVAEITLINEVKSPNSLYPIKTYRISVLDEDGEPIESQTQEFTLEGYQLAIDTMNINFDYSEISKGEHYNIAYPYRIHSDVVTSENGIPFQCYSEDGTAYPVMYGLENSVIYSMDRNTYYQNLNEIFSIAKDQVKAAEFGIRSFVGQDIHEPIYNNETYRLIVTGTGGVKLSRVEHLEVEDEDIEENSDTKTLDENNQEKEKKGFLSAAKDKITNIFN